MPGPAIIAIPLEMGIEIHKSHVSTEIALKSVRLGRMSCEIGSPWLGWAGWASKEPAELRNRLGWAGWASKSPLGKAGLLRLGVEVTAKRSISNSNSEWRARFDLKPTAHHRVDARRSISNSNSAWRARFDPGSRRVIALMHEGQHRDRILNGARVLLQGLGALP